MWCFGLSADDLYLMCSLSPSVSVSVSGNMHTHTQHDSVLLSTILAVSFPSFSIYGWNVICFFLQMLSELFDQNKTQLDFYE